MITLKQLLENSKEKTYVFGYEESYGCLLSPFVRDKDGIQAILLYAEMILFYKLKGYTLEERLDKIQKHTGLDLRKFSDAVTFRLMTVLFKLSK